VRYTSFAPALKHLVNSVPTVKGGVVPNENKLGFGPMSAMMEKLLE